MFRLGAFDLRLGQVGSAPVEAVLRLDGPDWIRRWLHWGQLADG